MKQHTSDFKETQVTLGKEQDIIITYGETEITGESVNSFKYSFEGNILKSIMTCVELDLLEDIPLNTKINIQYGLKVNGTFEYLNFDNYIVYSSEKLEDKGVYHIIAYDEMLDTMKDYEEVDIAYPCTIDDYITALAEQLGYDYTSSQYPNYSQELNGDYFKDVGYTYRDVLDDLAEVTASNILIKDGTLLIADYTETHETFGERFIKTTNAEFKTYGPINAIVLSRSISDNIYAKDQESIEENGLWEIKISDNQIMNNINRNEYITAIYDKLHGTSYTLCDFESVGIGYLEPLDMITIQIGETDYSNIIVYNDEYKAENGISEKIHVDEPKQSQTDYKKADTTDQRINQTNLIVDKQAQTITGIITDVGENTEHISTLTQTVDGFSADIQSANNNANEARQQTAQLSLDVAELRSEIGDVVDVTTTEEGYGTLSFENVNQSEPINITIHSSGTDIVYLYPRNDLYPSATLYPLSRSIVFENLTTEEKWSYTIPDDLLWYSSTIYDEFYLDYETETCQVTKRVGIDQNGDKYPLPTEVVTTYTYPTLELTDGDYSVYTPSYQSAYLKVRLMNKNPYTSQFATKVEMRSSISQSAEQIETNVANTYYTKGEGHTTESRVTQNANAIQTEVTNRTNADNSLSSRITQNANSITSEVTNRQNADNQLSSTITQTASSIRQEVSATYDTKTHVASIEVGLGEEIDGKIDRISGKTDKDAIVSYINASADRITLNSNRLVVNSDNFKVATDGTITATNGNFKGTITGTTINGGTISGTTVTGSTINSSNMNCYGSQKLTMYESNGIISAQLNRYGMYVYDDNGSYAGQYTCTNNGNSRAPGIENRYGQHLVVGVGEVYSNEDISSDYRMYAQEFIQTSLEEKKKNIEKYKDGALEKVMNTDVYNFKYKDSKDDATHIGFIIGDGYKLVDEIHNEKAVNIGDTVGMLWKAVQEQQAQIEELKEEINKLKGEK